MPGTVLGVGNMVANRKKCLVGLVVSTGSLIGKEISNPNSYTECDKCHEENL